MKIVTRNQVSIFYRLAMYIREREECKSRHPACPDAYKSPKRGIV